MLTLFDIKRLLNPNKDNEPEDDFRILQSWAEYDDTSSKSPEQRNLNYLCYELEVMNPDTGETTRFFKAIKFARIIRLPASAKQSTAFMDMQEGVLRGVYEQNYNFITIIANVIKPVPIGLLFMYGVQGVSKDINEAKRICHDDFTGFIAMMQGTYRVLEMKCAEAQETEWLREKIYNMDYMTMVRGIPFANKAGEDGGNKGVGGKNVNPDSEGTLEEMIEGMADYEYVIEVLSTAVYADTLMGWQRRSQKEMTDWNSHLQGQTSLSFNLSIPMMYMANASQSQGWSKAYTDASTVSYAQGENFSVSQGQSIGESLSQSYGQSIGHTEGYSLSNSISHGVTQSHGVSFGESIGQSNGTSIGTSSNFGVNQNSGINEGISQSLGQSTGQSSNLSYSESQSQNVSQGQNVSFSQGLTQGNSYSLTNGQTSGTSHSVGQNVSQGISQSHGTNMSQSSSVGTTASTSSSQSTTQGFTNGESWGHSSGVSSNHGASVNQGESVGHNSSAGGGWNAGITNHLGINGNSSDGDNTGSSYSTGKTDSYGNSFTSNNGGSYSQSNSASVSNGVTYGNSASQSASMGYSDSVGTTQSYGASENYGVSNSQSLSQSYGASESLSQSQSSGQSYSLSNGVSAGQSASIGSSTGQNYSLGNTYGVSQSQGASYGVGNNASVNNGTSYSANVGENYSVSSSETLGQTVGQSSSVSSSESASTGYGQNSSKSESVSSGNSYTTSNCSSQGTSMGSTNTSTLGTASSMGLGPSIGYNKSHQWLDQGVKDLLELMEYQNERIKKALRGNGAFYTYVYIACPSMDALSAAQALAKSTWHNEFAMVQPIQVLDLSESEQKHLLYHFAAFSADVTKEDVYGVEEYKYCTVLLPEEFVAYTHLPRVSEGGIYSIVQDIPKFSVPSMMKGEIYMGTVLNPERFTFKNGYRTPFDYRIPEEGLMHAYFTGASRSGKTVAATRFIAELSNVRRKKTGKRMRIVCLDPKQDWRVLARYIEPDRFNFYSIGNTKFRPIKINPWKVPHGVHPQIWIDGVIDIYCRAYGLLERGKQMIADVVYDLYEKAGVFRELDTNEDWKDTVPELSAQVNFTNIYRGFEQRKIAMEDPTNAKMRGGNDSRDAFARLLERLSCFAREYSIERQLYGTSEGIGIDELIGDDDITVLESKGLENTFKNFIFGVITSGFYKYAIAHEGGYLSEDQYETVLVIEEANEVLTGNDCAGSKGGGQVSLSGQSEFEQILDQSAGYGLFIIAITQKIADMPSSIIANSGLVFAGRLKRDIDVNVIVRSIGREERIDDRDTVKWFPRSPTGWFVCQTSRARDFKDAEPVLVSIARLNIKTPSNLELDEILERKRINLMMAG